MGNITGLLSMISISKKAGKLVCGETAVEQALAEDKARLVIVADDASANTKKKFGDKAGTHRIPILFLSDKETLGSAIGREFTASIAITDDGLAGAIIKKTKAPEMNGGI